MASQLIKAIPALQALVALNSSIHISSANVFPSRSEKLYKELSLLQIVLNETPSSFAMLLIFLKGSSKKIEPILSLILFEMKHPGSVSSLDCDVRIDLQALHKYLCLINLILTLWKEQLGALM